MTCALRERRYKGKGGHLELLLLGEGKKKLVCMVIICSKGKEQPGKVVNPARGQLSGEN